MDLLVLFSSFHSLSLKVLKISLAVHFQVGQVRYSLNGYSVITLNVTIKGGMDSVLETCCGSPAYAAPELGKQP